MSILILLSAIFIGFSAFCWAEYKPNSMDTPTIYINGQKREFKADL